MNIHEEYSLVELFAGAGGIGTGLVQAGLNVNFATDFDQAACDTYKANHPDTFVKCADIADVTGQMIREVIGNKKVILAGGPPCQSWSQMQEEIENSRQGLDDPRGQLIYQYLRIADELKPEIIIFENVSYLVEDKHLPEFRKFKASFERRTGLVLEYKVLNAIDYGQAQLRERVIMIGTRPGVPNPLRYIKPIAGPKTIREQLDAVQESPYWEFDARVKEIMRKIPAGKCWNVLPAQEAMKALGKDYRAICNVCHTSFQPQKYPNHTCPNCHHADQFSNGRGVTSYFRRLTWDRPSYTICTVPTSKEHGMLAHPDENRGLSIRECARLQGFPDSYEFKGTKQQQQRQIGNAVAVGMAKAIGHAVRHVVEGMLEEPKTQKRNASECLSKLIVHPQKEMLTSLERDFLNDVYRKLKAKQSIGEKYEQYLAETYDRLNLFQTFAIR